MKQLHSFDGTVYVIEYQLWPNNILLLTLRPSYINYVNPVIFITS